MPQLEEQQRIGDGGEQGNKKFTVEVTYNGVTKSIDVQPHEHVTALLQKSIATFAITQNQHLLSLYREDGTVVPENESVEQAGIKPGEILLLRPNAVKGGTLKVADEIVRQTFEMLRECGAGHRECVVYWVGPTDSDVVHHVEHPLHEGSAFGYEIVSDWLTQFWKKLASEKSSIKAQVHTHPGAAFHSATDDQWPIVSQAGFLSIVIPDFAAGAPSLERAWIGKLTSKGQWERVRSTAEAIA